ncbi:DUF2953 domain-containing protein [Gracilibacillus sp. YIM 98692]|uniref:DUF2953 domain-containing protein n=1 Tax=Gracilibacillus sp. YIM 98692 TaxID=2663532 RepID=UPI0013D4117D|nr:DUF2953 domain-containing protein [Gracilibacillus sp. YIM 98692]
MLILLGIIILLLGIVLILFTFLKLYIAVEWYMDQSEQVIDLIVIILGFKCYQYTLDFQEIFDDNGKESPSLSDLGGKERLSLLKSLWKSSRLERLETETVIGTGDPQVTAICYGLLHSVIQPLLQYLPKQPENLSILVDFQQERVESNGLCMISIHLRKTIRVLRKMKKKTRN